MYKYIHTYVYHKRTHTSVTLSQCSLHVTLKGDVWKIK